MMDKELDEGMDESDLIKELIDNEVMIMKLRFMEGSHGKAPENSHLLLSYGCDMLCLCCDVVLRFQSWLRGNVALYRFDEPVFGLCLDEAKQGVK